MMNNSNQECAKKPILIIGNKDRSGKSAQCMAQMPEAVIPK